MPMLKTVDHKSETSCCSSDTAVHPHDPDTRLGAFAALATNIEGDDYSLRLHVEGMHCASCMRLIEQALLAHDTVLSARVNMTTEQVAFTWRGNKTDADSFCDAVQKLGYKLHPIDQAAEQSLENEKHLLKTIAVAGFAAANMMLISVALWSSDTQTMGFATRDLFHWVSALIALPTVIYAGQPFFRSALGVLKEGHTNMDVPISLAVILAACMSLSETVRGGEYVYFDSAVMLLFFLLIGRYLDIKARGQARQSASKLLSRLHGFATKLVNGVKSSIAIRDIRVGDTILVAVGDSVPADGTISRGKSTIDMSLVTGETLPANVSLESPVFAGTVNLSAPFEMVVSEVSDDSLLSKVVQLLETAEQSNARYVRLADRAAQLYTPLVHSLGALTFLGWWLIISAPWQVSLLHAVTVLIITCPCALGLAVPVVQVLASSRLMKQGVLLKSGDALERLATIDTVVVDKTGTLTKGTPALVGGSYDETKLQIAASLASKSRHPLSKALSRYFEGKLSELNAEEIAGKGMSGHDDDRSYKLGSRNWCGEPGAPETKMQELWLAEDGEPVAVFHFMDELRDDAKITIQHLQSEGIDIHLLSGDREEVVQSVAASLGIETAVAEVSPIDKNTYIKGLTEAGKIVLMVGDGLNDAPALAQAHVSMSPSSAIDITQNTADIVYQGELLEPVFGTFKTAKKSTKLVLQNFSLAVAYNIVAIPMAVMGYVTPLIAAIAMSGSSLIVILNAFRLRRPGASK